MKKLNYDFLNCAKKMPPLQHRNAEHFDIKKSEVVRWLVAQPEIMQKIFDMAVNKKVIMFDRETAAWKGVNYDE